MFKATGMQMCISRLMMPAVHQTVCLELMLSAAIETASCKDHTCAEPADDPAGFVTNCDSQ